MVRKGIIVPPSCFLALSALSSFYAESLALPFPQACAVTAASAIVLSAFLLSLVFFVRDAKFRHSLFLFLCVLTGLVGGSLASYTLRLNVAPIASLAPRERVSGISVRFLADPVPWGPDRYRVPCRVTALHCPDGSSYSARGRCAVMLPSFLERESLPGGIAGKEGDSVPLSAGLSVTLEGSFAAWTSEAGEQFYAGDILRGSAKWENPVDSFRAGLRISLARLLYDWGDAGGFLLALFSANRDYLDPSLADEFKRTGLSHILALSGMHLSLLALIAIRIGSRIGGKRLSVRLSLVAIVAFVAFAGISPSLTRALGMAILMIAMKRLGFRPDILPVLALTAFAQLLLNPSDAISLAFILSYGALWGIVTFGESILTLLPSRFRVFPSGELAASIGAQLMTTPAIAVSLGVMAPVGVLASCVVSPLSSVFLVTGMALALIAAVLPVLGPACGYIVSALYRLTVFPVHFFAHFPPLSIRTLPATISACIFPLLAGLLLTRLASEALKRRSVDDCFARL